MRQLCGALLLTLACTSPASAPPQKKAQAAAVRDKPPPPTPQDPSYEVLTKLCSSALCNGPMASLRVFRNAEGEVARMRFDGDLEACSHPPRIYFDAEGVETLSIPNEPVEPGSEKATAYQRKQAAEVDGLVEAEALGCPEAEFCGTPRTEGFRSDFPCRTDDDCVECQCRPVNRDEWNRRGGSKACTDPSAECTATNPACCGGRCVLAR